MTLELIKIRLRSTLFVMSGRSKAAEKSKPTVVKGVLFALLYLYLGVVFLGASIGSAIFLGRILVPLGLGQIYLALFVLLTFTLIFVISIFETKTELFECRDNELLLSMPIPTRSIVAARISVVLVYNYAFSLMFMLPSSIVYFVLSSDVKGLIGGILATLLVPLPATALSSLVGYLVALLAKRTKKSTLVTVIFSLVFLAAYFFVYGKIMSAAMGSGEDMSGAIIGFAEQLSPISVIGGIVLLKPLETLVFIAFVSAILAVSYFLITRYYLAIITDTRGFGRVAYKAVKSEKRSPVLAIVTKELHRIFSSSIYLLNAGLGVVFRIAIGIFALVKADVLRGIITQLSAEVDVSRQVLVAIGVTAAAVMLSVMDMFSVSSVSLEGKSIWILRSMPISAKHVLVSKSLAHFAICAPATLISSVLLLIAADAPLSAIPLAVILPLIVCAIFAVFGTVINVAFPKLEFDNEAQPVKQSLAVFVDMMSQMLYGVIVAVGLVFLPAYIGVAWTIVIVTAVNILVLGLLMHVMMTASAKKFNVI